LFTVRKADPLLFVTSTEVLRLKLYWAEGQAFFGCQLIFCVVLLGYSCA